MKNLFRALVAIFLLPVGMAFAGDLLYPASLSPISTPISAPTFSGFNFGLEGGYAGGPINYDLTYTSPGPSGSGAVGMNSAGFLAGGFAGYDWQFPSGLVVGVVGSADWSGIESKTSAGIDGIGSVSGGSTVDWLLTGKGRIGWAMGSFMPYVAGGVAYGSVTTTAAATGWSGYSQQSNQLGWTAGAGLEAALTKNVFARVEYDYTDLGRAPVYSGPVFGGDNLDVGANAIVHSIKAGVGLRF